ncbi:MAG: carboxypeptidase regulatory-like domain-containing protein [bacterium]
MKQICFILLLFAGFLGIERFVWSQEGSQYQIIEVKNGGKLSGKVTFSGEVPIPKQLEITQDQNVCGKEPKHNESLVVSKESHGLRNVVGSIVNISKGKAWPADIEPSVLDQNGCRFDPHVLVVPKEAKFNVLNNDGIMHNIHTYSNENMPINRAQPRFIKNIPLKFDKPEFIKVTCDLHSWMNAWIVVAAHPYYTVTDENGSFTITDIPAGTYQIEFWHEKLGKQTKEITISGGGEAQLHVRYPLESQEKLSLQEASVKNQVSELIKELKDEDWIVRQSAAWKLGEWYKDHRPIKPLIEVASTDKMLPVRQEAKEALYKIADKDTFRQIIIQTIEALHQEKQALLEKQSEDRTLDERRYFVMSVDEARRLVEKIIKNHEFPPPEPTSYWKLPQLALNAQGIKINDNDYIVLASAEPSRILVLGDAPPGPGFLLIEDEQKLRSFVLNGILFSTVDMKVVNRSVFTISWTKGEQLLEKGGYKWYLGASGVYIEDEYNQGKIIFFEDPIMDFDYQAIYQVNLSIYPVENARISVKVGEKDIQLK